MAKKARPAPVHRVPGPNADLLHDLVAANRILYGQKVVDAFGHVSVRHDRDSGKYLMSRHLAPGLVTKQDIVTFDLDSVPVTDIGKRYYSERFIHGEIYKARPDVISVVHCHAPQLIPFGATDAKLRPIYHMSSFLGSGVPVYEIRAEGGMTDMLIRTPQLGAALAQSLGDKSVVLMRGHGATMVGETVRQSVWRAIYSALNAQLQMEAMRLGNVTYLADEEAALATAANNRSIDRAWALWEKEASPARR